MDVVFAFFKGDNLLFDGKQAEKTPKEMKKNKRIRLKTFRRPIFISPLQYYVGKKKAPAIADAEIAEEKIKGKSNPRS